MTTEAPAAAPVRKTITVKAAADRAFRVFTDGIDSWWPRTHHIGKSPMKRIVIEPFAGGRCYSEQEDGTDCPWGTVTAWEPPHRLVFAWQITGDWKFEADMAQCSEVEVRFTADGAGSTRVDLEHRGFERMGAGAAPMRMAIDSPNGWSGTLALFAQAVEP